MKNTISKLSIFALGIAFAASPALFAQPGSQWTPECNPSRASSGSMIELAREQSDDNTVLLGVSGTTGSDLACPYRVNVYATIYGTPGPHNYDQKKFLGTFSESGEFDYTNVELTGLKANSAYSVTACVEAKNDAMKCSPMVFISTPNISVNHNNANYSTATAPQIFAPVVGNVVITDRSDNEISIKTDLQFVGCGGTAWFEYTRADGSIGKTQPQDIGISFESTLYATIRGQDPEVRNTYRAFAQSCGGMMMSDKLAVSPRNTSLARSR